MASVSLSADGRLALSGSNDETMRLWEVATGRCLRTFEGHTGTVTSVSLSADGRLALSGGWDKTLRLWEMPGERYLCPLRPSRIRSQADMSQTETQAVALLLQAEHAYQETDIVTALNLVRQVRALPGWERSPKSMEMWRRLSLQCSRVGLHSSWLARTLQDHMDRVTSVSLSADGRLALSGSDKTVRLWEVATGRCLRTFQGHTGLVSSVSLSADGRLALSGSDDHTLRLWEVATGRCLRTFQEHAGDVWSVSFSADGRLALSGGFPKTVRLWEVTTGRCLRVFTGHTDWVWSVSLSADGRFALSGSWKMVRLWELDWELEARDPADWDEGAGPYLETFLTQHTPYAGVLPHDRHPSEQEIQQALTRRGRPTWTEQDFQELIRHLQDVGYGWLRPEGVHRKLEEMARSWNGPPPLKWMPDD